MTQVAAITRAALLTLGFLLVWCVGYYMSIYTPQLLAAWRFLNGTIVLFVVIMLLFKYREVLGILDTRLGELTAVIQKYLTNRDATISAFEERVTFLEGELARVKSERQNELGNMRRRHDDIP